MFPPLKKTPLFIALSCAIMATAHAAPITIDGNLSDWSQIDRLEVTPKPVVAGYETYGRFEDDKYKIAIHNTNGHIAANTTIWLDTDLNSGSGHLIWGFAGGAEYNVNIASDGLPYLYSGAEGQVFVSGPLTHSIISDGATGTNMEVEIPTTLLNNSEEVNLLFDLNNSTFLPSSYSPASNSYSISKSASLGRVTLDGKLTDWSDDDRIDSTNAVAGYKVYGRYENNSYKIALHNEVGTISAGTTLWLNSDQNTATGYSIWGALPGYDFNINVFTDGKPYLYSDADGQTYVSPLEHYITSDNNGGTVLEVEIPEALLNTPSNSGINILADVNNTQFLPAAYSTTNFLTLNKESLSEMGTIKIDGSDSDWNINDRLDLGTNGVNNAKLYGRYENDTYKILLHHTTATIGAGTTIWLNTDQNSSTGHQIWGFAGGSEYNINIDTAGVPYLYRNDAGQTYSSGPLNYSIQSDGATGSFFEIEVPAFKLGNPSGEGINLLLDANDSEYLPRFYTPDTNHYVLAHEPNNARIGIVYSETSSNYFFDKKAYSQLFMSVQSQAMMAGMPFDLLSDDDLLDLGKLKSYKTLIFPYSANVKLADLEQITQNLELAVTKHNVGIITAGNFLTNDENNASLPGDAYTRMKSLLGVTRVAGAGPVDVNFKVATTNHPITKDEYTSNEVIKSYTGIYTDYFTTTGTLNSAVVASQVINNVTQSALITSDNGGRNAHFATVSQMVDANLLAPTMQWSIYGEKAAASLQMSRNKAIFISRNDMDQSMFLDEVEIVNGGLLSVLQTWKQNYDFIGSYYINVGNDAANNETTDWSYSGPLYQQYMAASNEIGTHSYTHPHYTDTLTTEQIKFEFDDSRAVIEQNLNITDIGAAVPGAPENLTTSLDIIQYVDYLSGGYSSSGAGFNNAFGFLTPTTEKVYLSPNMSFDFTLIEFQKNTAAQAKQIWLNEFDELVSHNNQALIHWPWHDYGPLDPNNAGYTLDMFESVISKAHLYGSEFITGKDFSERIKSFKASTIKTSHTSNTIVADVKSTDAAQFALKIAAGNKIKSVDNWYAYDDQNVFLDKDAGKYTIQIGDTPDAVTHISSLPNRSQLLTLNGDGEDINFKFKGQGTVEVTLKCTPNGLYVGGGTSTYQHISPSIIALTYALDKEHDETYINATCP